MGIDDNKKQHTNPNEHKQNSSSVKEERTPPLAYSQNPPERSCDEDDEEEDSLLEILIQSLTGTTFHVKVSPWETGEGLKNLLHDTQGIPACHQHLLLREKELLDDESLIDQGVRDKSVLKLILSLKGGPVNSRRIPPNNDNVWSEFTDYFESNKEDLWNDSPGRQVTLLLLHEGEAVNLYKVVENDDGTLSPLDQSWASDLSDRRSDGSITSREEKVAEDLLVQNRLTTLRKKMEDMKISKKVRRQKSRKTESPSLPINLSARSIKFSRKSRSPRGAEASSRPASLRRAPQSRKSSIGGQSIEMPLTSRSIKTRNGSRPPSHNGNLRDISKLNVSRGSTVLEEIPRAVPPKHVDFSRHPRLDSIRPIRERNLLGPLKENASPLPEIDKKYEAYRHSLVRHGKVPHIPMTTESEPMKEDPTSGRQGPVPLYKDMSKDRRKKHGTKLNKTHNESSLSSLRELDDRPKTSPEILDRRPDSASTSTSVSEIIQMKGADDKLKEIIGILNSSRANTPLTHRSDSYKHHWLPQAHKKLSNPLHHQRGSFSVSVTSLRALSPTSICSTPPITKSGTKNRRKLQQEVYRAQSKPTKMNADLHKKTINSQGGTLTNGLPPVKKKKKRSQLRCTECRKKLVIGMSFVCRCGLTFCPQHRYPEAHSCSYDYKAQGKKLIELANPLVEPSKLPKI